MTTNQPPHVETNGAIMAVDYPAMLAEMTDTRAEDWQEAKGPDYGTGVSYHYVHDALGHEAAIVVDQENISFVVTDRDGDEVASAGIDVDGD